MTYDEMLKEVLSAGHVYDDVITEIGYRVRHGWADTFAALRSMHWDMRNDWGFTYLHKRNVSAVEWYREQVAKGVFG